MGEKKKRLDRFLSEHPMCCFCGGAVHATSIDHVPNRASFPFRQAPEGYEFPACDKCQGETRLDEIAFAFMVATLRQSSADFDGEGFERLMKGLKNNLPNARLKELTAIEKRQGIRELQIDRPNGIALSDLPMVGLSPEFHEHINRYLAKLTKALFYKHMGGPAEKNAFVWNTWTYGAVGRAREAVQSWIDKLPIYEQGQRRNVDLGNRFRYRMNYSEKENALAVVGQFSDGLIFYGVCVPAEMGERLEILRMERRAEKGPQ